MTHEGCKQENRKPGCKGSSKTGTFVAKFSARKSTDGSHFPPQHFPPRLVKNRGSDWPDLSPVVGMLTFPFRPQDQAQYICCLLHVANSGCQQLLTTLLLVWPMEQGIHWKPAKDICFGGFWQFSFGLEVASRSLIELSVFIVLLSPFSPQSFDLS